MTTVAPVTDSTALFLGTRKGAWILTADAERRSWSVDGPALPGPHRPARRARPPRRPHAAAGRGHRPPRPDAVPHDRLRRHLVRGVPTAGVPHRGAPRPQPAQGVLADARATPTSPGSGTPAAARRACSAARTPVTPGPRSTAGTTTRCGRPGRSTPRRTPPTARCCTRSSSTPATPTTSTSACPPAGCSRAPTAGRTGRTLNQDVEAVFLPEPDADYGHDPHCVRLHPADPDRLYQQNHCGIYRLDRPGRSWTRIGDNMPRGDR